MTSEELLKNLYKKDPTDYGVCFPPISAEDGLSVLINHFLGENWYTAMPVSTEQVYTEAICMILDNYKAKK